MRGNVIIELTLCILSHFTMNLLFIIFLFFSFNSILKFLFGAIAYFIDQIESNLVTNDKIKRQETKVEKAQ
jgi:hypothetical protein